MSDQIKCIYLNNNGLSYHPFTIRVNLYEDQQVENINVKVFNLNSDSKIPKQMCYLLDRNPFRNDEKLFLFHLKGSFFYQYI